MAVGDDADQQHIGVDVGSDREAEPREHTRRVALERRINVRPEVGKLDDLVEARLYLAP